VQRVFERSENLSGVVTVPPDKSISHRAAILSSLCRGESVIEGYSTAADCRSTLMCLGDLGVKQSWLGDKLTVEGRGAEGFDRPSGPLDCGNSATTMRLLAGVLAGEPFDVTLTGDESLLGRPMGRIIEPIAMMGAGISAEGEGERPPLRIKGGPLRGISYSPPMASAQVKSAILIAGLKARGSTTVSEIVQTRDHTERMLEVMGITVRRAGLAVSVEPGAPKPYDFDIPGDISSAAFIIAAALVCPGSKITLRDVGLNPTRTAFIDLLLRMGADVEIREEATGSWEPRGTIEVKYGSLSAIEVNPEDVAGAIDEIPLLALLATRANGRTEINGADELRHKESDRLGGTTHGLSSMGARVKETPGGMVIEGPTELAGAAVSSQRDHRLAMMFALAGLTASGQTTVWDWEFTDISYPGFDEVLKGLGARVVE
jgi:3-phosphoshikimate 1-carboxyvinyltransferase